MKRFVIQHFDDVWKIEKELKTLVGLKKIAVIFGSARIKEDKEEYQRTKRLAGRLVEHGYCVMTGGGLGIMEAANKGAKEHGGFCVGLTISLPREERPNAFLDVEVYFEEFWLRKLFFERLGDVFIVCPGGFGTLDELFEVLVLIQTKKRPMRSVVLYGEEFWRPLMTFFEASLIREDCVDESEMKIFKMADTLEEIEAILV